MNDAAISTLSTEESRLAWDRFDEAFDFKPSMHAFPAIREPVPSITWSLQALDDDPSHRKLDSLVMVVIDGLMACIPPGGSLLLLEWQHTSYRLRPDRSPTDLFLPDAPNARPRMPRSPYPDGDYPVLIAEDFSFGSFGHPWEQSICLFGAPLLDTVAEEVGPLLQTVLRRNGRPAATGRPRHWRRFHAR
jgi:hypothetical protein